MTDNNIIVSVEFRNYIERLSYEKSSRANLLNFMLMHNMQNEEMFEKIQTEYFEFYVQFELAKKRIEEIYLAPRYEILPRWILDFKSREIIIHE